MVKPGVINKVINLTVPQSKGVPQSKEYFELKTKKTTCPFNFLLKKHEKSLNPVPETRDLI